MYPIVDPEGKDNLLRFWCCGGPVLQNVGGMCQESPGVAVYLDFVIFYWG